MIKSIQQFQSKGVERLEKVFCSYADDLSKVAEMVEGVTQEMIRLGTEIIAEEWEFYDDLLHDNPDLRPGWYVIRKDEITRSTSLGNVRYHRTYFKNIKTGERSYLLDRLLGFEKGQRFTEDADARIFDEAADSSYRIVHLNCTYCIYKRFNLLIHIKILLFCIPCHRHFLSFTSIWSCMVSKKLQ